MITIARPYATAAFSFAVGKKDVAGWEAMLQLAAQLVQNQSLTQLLASPVVSSLQLSEVFCDLLASELNEERRNFIRVLAEHNRLAALADIYDLFKSYRAAQEQTLTVQVTSATPLTQDYQQKLINALTQRLQKKVNLQCEIDSTLLGGAIIRADDMVIDGSVRGKLTRLLDFL